MRVKEVLNETGVQAKAIVAKYGNKKFGKQEMSKVANGIVLPTKKLLEVICTLTGTAATDLYDVEEIDLASVGLQKSAQGERKADTHKRKHRKSFRLNQTGCNLFESEILNDLHYRSAQDWFDSMIEQTMRRYEKKKIARSSGKETSECEYIANTVYTVPCEK